MAVEALISPEEYLHMSFEGPEPDYVDGELMERSMPQPEHAETQTRLAEVFYEIKKQHGLRTYSELTVHVAADRFRVADFAVYPSDGPGSERPSQPPLAVIEILSPDDSLLELQRRFDDFRKMGTLHTWLADPWSRGLSVYTAEGLRRVEAFELPEYSIRIPISAIFE